MVCLQYINKTGYLLLIDIIQDICRVRGGPFEGGSRFGERNQIDNWKRNGSVKKHSMTGNFIFERFGTIVMYNLISSSVE